MPFPTSPANNDITTLNGITYIYNSSTSSWTRVTASLGNIGNITVTNNANLTNVYGSVGAFTGNLSAAGIVGTTYYGQINLGTTSVNLNRTSGAQVFTGVGIDGTAGTATNAINTQVTSNISSGTAYVTFVSTTSGNVAQNINTGFTYNPNTGNLRTYAAFVDTNLTTGNIIPSANVTYSLGSSTNRWKDLWISGNTIYIGKETISVDGSGQWTFSTGSGNINLGSTAEFNPSSANIGGVLKSTGNIVAAATTTSTSTTTGALVVSGGAGINGALYILNTGDVSANLGAFQTFSNANASTQATSINTTNANIGAFQTYANANIGTLFTGNNTTNANLGAFQLYANANIGTLFNGNVSTNANVGAFQSYANTKIGTNTNSNLVVVATTTSTSTTTGALVVGGGIGIAANVVTGGWIIPSSNISQNLGTTTQWWNVFYGVSTQARYADLAENYQADSKYEPGTVLVFGGNKEVTISTQSHDIAVAGVVSTNPAHLMNGALTGKNVVALALQGRVPCLVRGPVNKGTVLVTSEKAGVAEAIDYSMFKPGCVLGKSLEEILDASVKLIEVVVGRF